ncbi:MAG: hypothetical protein K2M30_04280 [Desulfovibrionaceae bacterium]|nr:hypothetical protein [Desulfovibrionaceae bacterium]
MKLLLELQTSLARRIALSTIYRVYKSPLHVQRALSKEIARYSISPEEVALSTELTYGYLRYAIQIEAILRDYLHAIHKMPEALLFVLGLAIYEVLYTDASTDSTVVFHTVELIKKRYNTSLGRVANAVLRNVIRTRSEHITYQYRYKHATTQEEQYASQYSLPFYMWSMLTECFQDDAHLYAQHFLTRPVRTEEEYNPSTALLFKELNIEKLHKDSIWECCSGIGGKKNLLLSQGISPIIASDISVHKLNTHKHKEFLLCTDATLPPFKNESFSLVVADVPCSGTGTLRKRPDIKIHRKKSDIDDLCRLQRAILEGISRTVKSGGHILYITCSLYKKENERQIEAFIKGNQEFSLKQEYTVPLHQEINDILYGAVLEKH